MAVLGTKAYDPASAVSKATSALLAMTALDITNLRITFTAPANGAVSVRLKGVLHGATTFPRIFLGVLDGSTVVARMVPTGQYVMATAAGFMTVEAVFVVTGLTPSQEYTWDAAYGVDVVVASSAIKYGGPNNATANDAFGAFFFDIWPAGQLLGAKLYDPSTAVSKVTTTAIAMTAIDATNLAITFTAPASGKVFWRIKTGHHGASTHGAHLLGIVTGLGSVLARSAPLMAYSSTLGSSSCWAMEASGILDLNVSQEYTLLAAYGVETVSVGGAIKFGGPDNAVTNDAFGAIAYELWAA